MRTHNFTDVLTLNLQLFAEGAGDGAPAAESAPVAEGQAAEIGSPAAEQTEAPPVDLDAEFENLVKGKYKAQYQKRFKDGVSSRLKGINAKMDKLEEFAATFADRQGLDYTGDIDALTAKLDGMRRADVHERAYANGVSDETQEAIDRKDAQIRKLERERLQRDRTEYMEKQYHAWTKEGEELKKSFPDFDFDDEMQNDKFKKCLYDGYSVEDAYIMAHHKDIIPNAMAYTAKKVEEAVVNKVRANGARPSENGTAAQSSAQVSIDPGKLTPQQINEYIERARRGERITFS